MKLLLLRDSDLHWLAGLVEGEGCFTVCGGGRRNTPTFAIGMTDLDVMQRVSKLVGKSLYTRTANGFSPTTGKPYKDAYRLHLYGAPAVRLMKRLYPLMGSRRRARIREILGATGRGSVE